MINQSSKVELSDIIASNTIRSVGSKLMPPERWYANFPVSLLQNKDIDILGKSGLNITYNDKNINLYGFENIMNPSYKNSKPNIEFTKSEMGKFLAMGAFAVAGVSTMFTMITSNTYPEILSKNPPLEISILMFTSMLSSLLGGEIYDRLKQPKVNRQFIKNLKQLDNFIENNDISIESTQANKKIKFK